MYRSIAVPLDGSPFAEQALGPALTIAEAQGAAVTLVRAWDPSNYRYASELTPPIFDPEARGRLAATEYLDDVASRLRPSTKARIEVAVVAGPPADAIGDHLARVGADLVVMTTHGLTGWSRAWLGSVADALVRILTIPVLLIRPQESATEAIAGRFARVLIPLDGSLEAEQILPHAMALARNGDTRIVLVRIARAVMTPVHAYAYAAPAWQPDADATEAVVTQARDYLNGVAAQLRERFPRMTVDVDVRLAERAGSAIIDAARDNTADLVTLTTHTRRAVRLVLGSVADKVLRGTHGSVLVLRPQAAKPATHEPGHALAGTVL